MEHGIFKLKERPGQWLIFWGKDEDGEPMVALGMVEETLFSQAGEAGEDIEGYLSYHGGRKSNHDSFDEAVEALAARCGGFDAVKKHAIRINDLLREGK